MSFQFYYHKEGSNMLKPLAFLHKMLLFHILRNILFVLYKSYNSLQFTQPIHLSLAFADLNNLLLGHRYGYNITFHTSWPCLFLIAGSFQTK